MMNALIAKPRMPMKTPTPPEVIRTHCSICGGIFPPPRPGPKAPAPNPRRFETTLQMAVRTQMIPTTINAVAGPETIASAFPTEAVSGVPLGIGWGTVTNSGKLAC